MALRQNVRLLLALFLIWGTAHAQQFLGSVQGNIADATGARIPGAVVRIQRVGSSASRTFISDGQGMFAVDDLLPGNYRIHVKAQGFEEAERVVVVEVSSSLNTAVVLRPSTLKQTVNVQGEVSSISEEPIASSSTVQQGVVTSRDLQTIPLAHRSFANIAYLVPGTEPVEPSDPTKARITAVSFGGSSGLNDIVSVDGADNSDDYIGGFLQNFSPDVIQEFAVQTAQEDAATGRTVGGSVIITTKRGTNEWHGAGAFYERAAALNARYPIDNPAPLPKQPFSRQNYVGTLGAPIVRDKLWFFSSLEAVHERASVAYSPANLTQFHALANLAAEGLLPGVTSISVPNSVPVPFRDFLATQRFDWAQSPRSQWFLRAAGDTYVTNNALVQQGTLPSTGTTWHSNYFNVVLSNEFAFNPSWLASLSVDASFLHLKQTRNSQLGFALAFPFSSTAQTISGFETFGDNQFVTPITAFPVLRNQEKYQMRYALTHVTGRHSSTWGVDVIHEPALSGALAADPETLTVFAQNPTDYLSDPQQFVVDLTCAPAGALAVTPGTTCTSTPAGNGSFSQNVQRLGFYAKDSWHATRSLTINYGLRYDTTFGLFTASGRSQWQNPALLTIQTLQVPLFEDPAVPHDYRRAIAPRLGLAYAVGRSGKTVLRAGFGLFYNDLAQNGWVTAFQAVNEPGLACAAPGDPGCLPGAAFGGTGVLIDPAYKTPYALHATGGVEHAFNSNWIISAGWTHEQGVHSYRRYEYTAGSTLISPLYALDAVTQQQYVPNVSVFRSDNRSSYEAMMIHLQGNLSNRLNLIVNYTLSSAKTWGCVLGELFDYVNGVCNPLNAFTKGDYGPSGEDVTHRFVFAGVLHIKGGIEISSLAQAESARPFTMTTPVDVNGLGDSIDDRAIVNGVQTSLDQFRGTPYIQVDCRVTRPIRVGESRTLSPFIEFFNLFNRNNPGANFVTNLAALPNPVDSLYNATAVCADPNCSRTQPIVNLNQLRVPAGALGDFFGPGTTVGIPFAAQVGVRFTF